MKTKIKYILFSILTLFFSSVVFALDTDVSNLGDQTSIFSGSSNSLISTFSGTSLTPSFSGWYINRDNDSTIVGNYLRGYYSDSNYGFFRFDWSNNSTENIRIIGSSDKCLNGYGYMFGGFARSIETSSGSNSGFMNFHYSSDVYVYFCENDNKLHGYAYNEDYGFQNFEGLSLDGIKTTGTQAIIDNSYIDPFFTNNITNIINGDYIGVSKIQGDIVDTELGKEMIWYIIK